MTEAFSPTFRLVPQRDRRQRPDRRMLWRGGRRSTDSPRDETNRESGWQNQEQDGEAELADEEGVSRVCALG